MVRAGGFSRQPRQMCSSRVHGTEMTLEEVESSLTMELYYGTDFVILGIEGGNGKNLL